MELLHILHNLLVIQMSDFLPDFLSSEESCMLIDKKGSLNVIRRPLMPFDNPECFPTRTDLIAKPLPASCFTSLLGPLQKILLPVPTNLIFPISEKQVSFRVPVSIPYLQSFLPTRAVLWYGLSDPALSIRVWTFQMPIFKDITFYLFLWVRPLKGTPADDS